MPATAVAAPTFACPGCRRPYAWRAENVGRVARCPCGYVFRVPPAPRADVLPGTLDPDQVTEVVSPPPASRRPGVRRAPCEVPQADDPAVDAEIAAALAETARYGDRPAVAVGFDPWRDIQLPLLLLSGGLFFMFAQIAVVTHSSMLGLVTGSIIVAAQMTVSVLLMLVGVTLAAYFAGINFGHFGCALLKLCAIYVGPTAAGAIVTHLLGGDLTAVLFGCGISITLYWWLVSHLFRLSGAQTMISVFAIAGVRLLTQLLLLALIAMLALRLCGPIEPLAKNTPAPQEAGIVELGQ